MPALPPPRPRRARGRAAVRRPPGGRIPPRPDRCRPSLSLRLGASIGGPPTRGPDRLLGPCFKTGRQGSRQSPADPGRRGATDTGGGSGGAARRHRERSRRPDALRPAGRSGPDPAPPAPAGPEGPPERKTGRGRRGPSSLPRSGRRREHGRAVGSPDRPPRRRAGLAGGTPPGRPLPAN